MTKLYWHVHHEILCEPSKDIGERISYIKVDKPEHERETRLRLTHEVKNPPIEVVEAATVWERAQDFYQDIWSSCFQTQEERRGIWAAARQARADYDQVLVTFKDELEALHKIECPNCPWTGHTILPKEKT